MNYVNISITHNTEQIKPKSYLENIKSDYFLQKLFGVSKKIKSLEIAKYNKILQKRLNLCLNDYKEYSQFYSPIVIELGLFDDKYDKFINIPNNKKRYYHIYFDNTNEEIKRNFLNQNEKIKMIKIIIDYQVNSFKGLFDNCQCINSINFKKFHRINITDMSDMFSRCSSLQEINLSNFNTNNVTNMSYMFHDCSSLKEINLSNFSTNNVINMSYMFSKCSSLLELNLLNFNTINVKYMSGLFAGCSSLKDLDLSNFNMNNVVDMSGIIWGCSFELRKKIKAQNKKIKC